MRMRTTIVTGLAVCMAAAAPGAVWAQAAAQTVAEQRPDKPDPRGAERAWSRVPARPAEEESGEMLKFMQEHSPNRVKAMESLPEESSARRGVLAFVSARYRALQAVRDEDPKLYEIKVKQVELEDALYGLLAPARTVAARERLRDQVRTLTRQLVEQNMAERDQRLSRLRDSLQREEQKLQSDRARMDAITESRTGMLVQEGPAALRREMVRQGLRDEARRENRPLGAATRPIER